MKNRIICVSKYIRICTVLVLMFVLSSCMDSKLRLEIEKINAECPISLGTYVEMTGVSYNDDEIVFLFTIDDKVYKLDKLVMNPEEIKVPLLTSMRQDETKGLLELMVKEDLGLCYSFKEKISGKEVSVQLSTNELKEELDKPLATNEEILKTAIMSTNKQVPVDTGTGLILTEVFDSGENVVYMYNVTSKEQFKLIERDIDNVKDRQKRLFKTGEELERIILQIITEAGRGIVYTYYWEGSEGTVNVMFTNDELREICTFESIN